jgi:hypothetical protein
VTSYPVNGARTIKRGRRTKAEVAELREALQEIVMDRIPSIYVSSSLPNKKSGEDCETCKTLSGVRHDAL